MMIPAPVFFHLTGYFFSTHMADALQQPEWFRIALRLGL
jgi:hypothetical protein